MNAIRTAAAQPTLSLKPLAVFVCTGMAVVIALLVCAPDPMVKDWGMGLLDALGIEAPLVWDLVLDSPDLWHVFVFAVLTLGLLIAIPGRPHLCVNTAMLLGVFLEAAQMFVPSREAGLADLLYNLAGASLGLFVFMGLRALIRTAQAYMKPVFHPKESL